jgi:rSAM/selenodomain-associated transferase 1
VNSTRIVIFAKAPLAGYAKTRLIPALGVDGAARLARHMLLHAVRTACAAELGPVELCVAPDRVDPVWRALDLPAGLIWSEQGDGDLGARMARAATRALTAGSNVVLIGTDCPALGVVDLQNAAAALREHDATMVPVSDGGYVLLGLRRFHATLFDDMPWSTNVVAEQTLRRLGAIAWSVKVQTTLHDIDEPDDLQWLPPDWAHLKTMNDHAVQNN